jgi:hypothetical protein
MYFMNWSQIKTLPDVAAHSEDVLLSRCDTIPRSVERSGTIPIIYADFFWVQKSKFYAKEYES